MIIRQLSALLMLSVVTTSSFSASLYEDRKTKNIWYLGVDLGQGNVSANVDGLSVKEDSSSLAGMHLGHIFSDYFSVELGYQYLGESVYKLDYGTEYKVNFQQAVLSAKLAYPITSRFSPYIKVGTSYWFGDNDGEREQGTSMVYGAGLRYSLTENFDVRTEYQFTESMVDGALKNGFDHNAITFGLSYRFGDSKGKSTEVVPATPVKQIVTETHEEPISQAPPITIVEQNTYVRQVVLFESDSSMVTSTEIMDVVLDAMKQDENATAIISGHTDSTGSEQYNQKLSESRTKQVFKVLTDNDIEQKRITTNSQGELQPIADNNTVEGRALNRRVEIIIE